MYLWFLGDTGGGEVHGGLHLRLAASKSYQWRSLSTGDDLTTMLETEASSCPKKLGFQKEKWAKLEQRGKA